MLLKYYSYKNALKILFFYRILMTFVVVYIVDPLTKLGDDTFYLKTDLLWLIQTRGLGVLTGKTHFARLFVAIVHLVLRFEILTHIFFCILAFYGLKVFLDSIKEKESWQFKILLLLCFTPSFTLWTSIVGKEAMILFAMGIICSQLIRFFQGEQFRLTPLLAVSAYFIVIMKPQYVPAVLQLVAYIKMREFLLPRAGIKADLFLIAFFVIANLSFLYFFRYRIGEYAVDFQPRFRPDARSTRDNVFFEPLDFFVKMPYLLPLSLWGPTISEARTSVFHIMAFAESAVLSVLVSFLLVNGTIISVKNIKSHYHWFFLLLNTYALLFFAQYLQGVLNPGSAVRYRSNIYLLIIALSFCAGCIPFRKNGELKIEK